MPFVAECPFCKHQMECPDRAMGGSGLCPKCSNYFMPVPVAQQPRAAKRAGVRAPTPPPAPRPNPPQKPTG